jgi:hypothetical protein
MVAKIFTMYAFLEDIAPKSAAETTERLKYIHNLLLGRETPRHAPG